MWTSILAEPVKQERKIKILWRNKKKIFSISIITLVLFGPLFLLIDNWYATTNTTIGTFSNSDQSLQLATFNIHQFWSEQDSSAYLQKFRDLIKSENIDIIGLQEMWQGNASYIANELNMYYFNTSDSHQDSFYGLALLSKFPILETQTFVFNSSSANFIRAMIWAKININNKNISVYVTHLDTPASYFSQVNQAKKILDVIDTKADSVLLCDCNAPDTVFLETYRLLTEHFEDSWIASGKKTFEGRTWPSDNPFLRVDYVWLSNNGWLVQENSGKILGSSSYSDHLGVKVTVIKT